MPSKTNTKSALEIDKYIGQRLRIRRMMLKLSQGDLAEKVGVTFQQLQKYENGSNRVSAGRLFAFSKALTVPVSYFFNGFEGEISNNKDIVMESESVFDKDINDPLKDKNCTKLIMAYSRINDDTLKIKVMELVLSLASLGKNKSVKDDISKK